MSQWKKIFCVELLTPEGSQLKAEAVSAVLPAADGEIGILADRAPLIATLGAGHLRVEKSDGHVADYYVAGGFARVAENAVTVLAETALPVEKLNVEQAQEELTRAEAMPSDTQEARDHRRAAVNAATRKLAMAKEHAGAGAER